MSQIHKTAIINKNVKIGKNVIIGPYCVLSSPDIVLEDGASLKSHVTIEGDVVVGENTKIASYACIGAETTNLSFRGEKTYVRIGKNCDIREYVSINSSCGEKTTVRVGDNVLLMPYAFVAHNCSVGNNVIMTNGATLAGHVTIGEFAILGGLCAVAQHVRVGAHAMIGGGSMLGLDVPPFAMCSGYPAKVSSLNIVGMKRRKFPASTQRDLAKAFRITYKMGLRWVDAREQIIETIAQSEQIDDWVQFCSSCKKGIAHYRKDLSSQAPLKELKEV